MKKTVQYHDQMERTDILDSNSELFLVEEQNITEGNFLIFSDIPSIELTLTQLADDNLVLMDVMATMYEDMLAKGTV